MGIEVSTSDLRTQAYAANNSGADEVTSAEARTIVQSFVSQGATAADIGRALDNLSADPNLRDEDRAAIRQAAVLVHMESLIGHAPRNPPSASDLREYGAALGSGSTQDLDAAFTTYCRTFLSHADRIPGHPDVAYPDGATPDMATSRSTRRGRQIDDCDGYSLRAQAFYQGAGYNTEFVVAQGSEGAHRMLYAHRRGEGGVLASNELTYRGPDRPHPTRALCQQGLTHAGVGSGERFVRTPNFENTLSGTPIR